MGALVDTDRLRWEAHRRGWTSAQLARAARLSPPTVSAALAGRPVAAASVAQIAKALVAAPVIDGIDTILRQPPEPEQGTGGQE